MNGWMDGWMDGWTREAHTPDSAEKFKVELKG